MARGVSVPASLSVRRWVLKSLQMLARVVIARARLSIASGAARIGSGAGLCGAALVLVVIGLSVRRDRRGARGIARIYLSVRTGW